MSRVVIDAPDMSVIELNLWLSLHMKGSGRALKNHCRNVSVGDERIPVFNVEPICNVLQFRRNQFEPQTAA